MRTTSEVIKILRKYTNELQEQFDIEELKLYGSYAKNNQHLNSDVDLLYRMKEGHRLPLMKQIKLQNFITRILGIEKIEVVNKKFINPIVYKDAEQYAIIIF